MSYEIERKFLVDKDKLPTVYDREYIIKQAYIISDNRGVVRIRQQDDKYILTIKLKDVGIRQIEIERDLTEDEFDILWNKADKKLFKTRKVIGHWEIDFFHNLSDKYADLILAEIELTSVDEYVTIPTWVNTEVTGNSDFFNNNLIKWSIQYG